MAARRYEISPPVLSAIFICNHSNSDVFTCENNMLSSRVKISCFRAKSHLVFHWCLYNNGEYRPSVLTATTSTALATPGW